MTTPEIIRTPDIDDAMHQARAAEIEAIRAGMSPRAEAPVMRTAVSETTLTFGAWATARTTTVADEWLQSDRAWQRWKG